MLDRILLVALALFFTSAPHSQASRFDLEKPGSYEIGQYIDYWQDPTTDHSLIDVSRLSEWQSTENANINLGISASPFWFKTTINLQNNELAWFVKITYPPLDHIELYLCQQEVISNIDTECRLTQAGDSLPFDQRIRRNPNYIIPLTLQPGNNFLYIKVITDGSYQLPISIVDQKSLDNYLTSNDFFRGAYLSLMLVMTLYNLFIFMMTRSSTYLFYSGFVCSFALFHMAYEGSGFQLLWPQWPSFNQYAMPIAFALNQIFTVLFVVKFLNIKRTSKASYTYFNILLGISILALLLATVIPYKIFIPLLNLLSITINASAFYLGLRYSQQGQTSARLFTLAWAVFIIGIVTANFRILGIIPSNFFTQYGYQIGSFIEILLLSLAVGERIQRLQSERMVAKQALIQEKNDRMAELQQLIIGVSHEMNTPIGNIGLSNSFLMDLHKDMKSQGFENISSTDIQKYVELQQQALTTTASSTKTLSSLTQVFKNIAIKKRDHPALEFDLVSLIYDRTLTYSERLTFELSLPESCLINSHPSAFILVLDQLFDNTLIHFPEEKSSETPRVSIAMRQDEHSLTLDINDNGEGLNNEELTKLFLPFFTKARGNRKKMGLGMYQVKNIINDIFDGSIKASSGKGFGLKLTITLPVE